MALMNGKRARTDRHLTVVPGLPAETTSRTGGEPGAADSAHERRNLEPPRDALFGIEPDLTPSERRQHPPQSLPTDRDGDLLACESALFPPGASAADIYQIVSDAGAPAELLSMIEGFGEDVEALAAWLGEMGLDGSPQETLDGILAGWRPLLKRGTSALDAELSGAEFLRIFETTVGEGDPADPLAQLITDAAATGAREALAMTRVLSFLGPLPVQRAATAAAHRLAASGAKDMPWVRSLGRPEWVSAFGFADPLGSQESLAIEFRYGKRSHACVLLIDHDLGGGVKDCWFTDEVPRIRAQFQLAANDVRKALSGYTAQRAATILQAALAAPPCPADEEQIEDVGTYLRLVRSRLLLLPSPTPTASVASGTSPAPGPAPVTSSARTGRGSPATIHRVKVTLAGARPPIWRRLEVASTTTLADLHEILQASFEWDGGHLWVFQTPRGEYGVPDPELDHLNAARLTLAKAAPKSGSRIKYVYDFGDDWQHVIQVEAIVPADDDICYPWCIGGRRAAPPEDCGGVWGYADLIETLGDTKHPGHAAMLEWLGLGSPADFDPSHFEAAELNELLMEFAAPR